MVPAMATRQQTINGVPRHMFGWRPEHFDHRDCTFLPTIPASLLPSRVDLRAHCSPVEDQGSIGSCVANASTSMMEALYRKMGRPNPELSRLYLYWVTRVVVEGTPAEEDSGCMIRDAVRVLAQTGTCLERTWPYVPAKYATTPPSNAAVEAAAHRILRYERCNTLLTIKAALAQGFTVTGGFSVPENMLSTECAETGVVRYPMPDERIVGGHAVHFVGYDNGSQLLFFQNSWGTGWGKSGFGFLPYGFVDHRLADDFWVVRSEMMP